jgi:hypothetical protein
LVDKRLAEAKDAMDEITQDFDTKAPPGMTREKENVF